MRRSFPRRCRPSRIICARAGYQTVLSGKMHFCGADQLHGFEERLTTDIYPADFGWTPDWTRFEQRPSWYHTMDSVTQAGPCARTNQIDFDDDVVFQARQKIFDLARSRDRRPFCMVASMTHPHDPYVIPQRYWDRYEGVDIDMPRVRMSPEQLDPHSRRLRHVCGLDLQPVTETQVRAARRAYYGAVSYVDDQIGVLLGALARCGLRRQHHRAAARRSRRHAGRARALVQDEFLRAGVPDPVHRACAAALRRAARARVRLAGRSTADAERARGRHARRLRDTARRREPGAAARGRAGPGRGDRRVPRRGRDRAAGDDQARPLQVRALARSIRISSTISPRIPTSSQSRAGPAAQERVREFRAEVERRWDLAGLCTPRCSRASGAGIWCTGRCARAATRPGTFSPCAMPAGCTCATIRSSATWKPWRASRRTARRASGPRKRTLVA